MIFIFLQIELSPFVSVTSSSSQTALTKIKNTMPFIFGPKIKYFGINLTKLVRHMFVKINSIKEDFDKLRFTNIMDWKINSKNANCPQIYKLV